MKRGALSSLAFLALGCAALSAWASVAPARDNRALYGLWDKIRQPLAESAQPIGAYGAGCLAGARALPIDGTGYSVMHPSRLRYFGHPALVSYVQELGLRLKKEGLPLLLVGDLGRPRGGPMRSGHASHQIGLDVDLWYRLSRRRPSARDREHWSSGELVRGLTALRKGWTEQQRKLVADAASAPEVERVFVNAAIKRDLCGRFPGAPWLYKVRAWFGHADHLHVRLHCPEGSTGCKAQDPLDPAKLQCGEELAWWFSKEAEEEARRKQATEREFPELPAECEKMVKELRADRL